MKNIRFVSICAASGFVLSLICGFFSKSGFLHIFLLALLFGLVFGALAFGISFVYDKFLVVEGAGYAADSSDSSADASDGIGVASKDKKNLGQHVDLVIQEEELEQSGNVNHYNVGDNHQMLNESDYTPQKEEKIVPKNEFVPLREKETVNNFSGAEAITPQDSEKRMEAIVEQEEKNGSDLDVLPDMGELNIASSEGGEDGDTIVLSNSDEGDFISSATNYKSSNTNEPEIKDASLMAKAISSILAEET